MSSAELRKIAIQGERGSNSHMAAVEMLGGAVEIVPCTMSTDVIDAVVSERVDGAVLPIENSLHGPVAEHYDLLLEHAIRIDRESLLRIRHNLIAAPGVELKDVRQVISHPVALSQCRHYLGALRHARAMPFYDTAGSVKHLMAEGLRDTAGVAPALAAEVYGANILVSAIEDNAVNFTRFHLLRSKDSASVAVEAPNKISLAFAVEHRPGTLVAALQLLADARVDLTKIESRPVPGSPWEYIFYVDFRFDAVEPAESALAGLRAHCRMVKELGRYKAAS
jgi:prephenate dehydratase